jgi:hypothetical protein
MIDWAAALAVNQAVTASIFETVSCRLVPMTRPNGGRDVNASAPVADASRAAFEFLADFGREPANTAIPRHQPGDREGPTDAVAYDAAITCLTTDWPWQPHRGSDRVEIGDEVFKIMAERGDGTARKTFYLNRVA